MTDPLSRLRAGLAEDERIAREAIDSLRRSDMEPTLRYEGDVGTWIAEPHQHGAGVRSVDVEIREEGEPESWRGPRTVIFSGDGEPTSEVAEHAARQDPKATLDRVEAIRETVIRPYEQAIAELDLNARDALGGVIAALASIYPEPTETGDTR
ncbi:DUF6221 family protein [Nocardia sp. NPDC019255]|uniref:DUF6221 family protein n=1 Tax=Nocardia sp. NPDC019255 TaxID=3154591 RepID=UPI0034068122